MPGRTWSMSRLPPVHGDPTGGKWRNKYSTLTLVPPSNILLVLTKGQLAARGLGSAMVYVYKSVSLGKHMGEGSGSGGAPRRSSSITIHMR